MLRARNSGLGSGAYAKELVAEAVVGDVAAQESLMGEVQPIVLRYCRARLAAHDPAYGSADDVAQEICISVLTSLPRYRDMGRPFIAFVYGVAAHKVADAYRSAARHSSDSFADLPEIVDGAKTPEDAALASESLDLTLQLLDLLPEAQREIVTLRVAVGLSAEQTAQALNMKPGAVRVAQHRALTKLRRLIAQRREKAEGNTP